MVSSQNIDPIIEELVARQQSMERELAELRETIEAAANGSVSAAVLRADFREVRGEFATLRGDMHRDSTELREQIAALTVQFQSDFAALRGDMHRDSTELREQITALTLQSQGDIAAVRSELRDQTVALTSQLEREIGGLRGELHDQTAALTLQSQSDVAAVRGELRDQTTALTSQFQKDIGGLREEIAGLKGQFAAFDQRLENLVWRGLGGMLAIAIAVVTLVRLLW